MRAAFFAWAVVLALATTAFAQAVPEGIAPDAQPPEGCKTTVEGNFTIGIGSLGRRVKRESAVEAANDALTCTLADGVLRDPHGRIGSVVANYQFQFDGPPQAGAIYTGGFSVCANGSLALGASTRWFRCMSGEFGNLYDRSIGDQCAEVRIVVSMIGATKPKEGGEGEPVTATKTEEQFGATRVTQTGTGEETGWTAPLRPSEGSLAVSVITESLSDVTNLSGTRFASATAAATTAAEKTTASSTTKTGLEGFAAPTRVPKRETFGAVVGLLGAALLL